MAANSLKISLRQIAPCRDYHRRQAASTLYIPARRHGQSPRGWLRRNRTAGRKTYADVTLDEEPRQTLAWMEGHTASAGTKQLITMLPRWCTYHTTASPTGLPRSRMMACAGTCIHWPSIGTQ